MKKHNNSTTATAVQCNITAGPPLDASYINKHMLLMSQQKVGVSATFWLGEKQNKHLKKTINMPTPSQPPKLNSVLFV